METLTVFSMFSGIGGFDIGLENTGRFQTIAFSEIDSYACKVLAHHWPSVPNLSDCTKIDYNKWTQPTPDVIVAGFPCQDISVAGNQKGIKDGARSGLWFEVERAISILRPLYVILENVAAITSSNGGSDGRIVVGSLTALGYDSEWAIIRASDVGAPHQRARWFCIACQTMGNAEYNGYAAATEPSRNGSPNETCTARTFKSSKSSGTGCAVEIQSMADAACERMEGHMAGRQQKLQPPIRKRLSGRNGFGSRIFTQPSRSEFWNDGMSGSRGRLIKPGLCLLADGIPNRVSKLRGLGNAVVPQVAQHVGECLISFHDKRKTMK